MSNTTTIIGSFLISTTVVFGLLAWPNFTSAQFASHCNPTFFAKPSSSATSGTTEIIVKPADVKKLEFEVKFNTGGIGSSIQSDCTGKARVFYAWNNTYTEIPINVNKAFVLNNIPSTEGVYRLILGLSDPADFQEKNIYLTKEVIVKVAKDILNPPDGNGGGTIGTNNGNGANGNASINVNPGLNNNQINTAIGVNFNINYDASIGNFFNPLDAESIPELIVRLTRILFVLTGIVAVIVIIIAGFRMVVDSGNETQMAKAKAAITWAVVGLMVSILAFSIVAIIQRIIQT